MSPLGGEQDIPFQIDLCLRARITLLILHTPEEERAMRMLQEVCSRFSPKRPFLAWDIAEGFSGPGCGAGRGSPARDPLVALEEIEKTDEAAVIVLKDFHEFWGNPGVKRRLRNLAQKLRFTRRTMVVVTPSLRVPDEIRDDAVVLHVPPPSARELEQELDRLLVFEVVNGMFGGVTAFAPMQRGVADLKYLERQRQGVLLYKR